MKQTFKQFLESTKINDFGKKDEDGGASLSIMMNKAIAIVKKLIGPNIKSSSTIDDELLDTARQDKNERVDSAFGTWMISSFNTRDSKFARISPPKETETKPSYYFQVKE